MYKPELCIQLLEEMADKQDGTIVDIRSGRVSERRHHIELLVDSGLATWRGSRSTPTLVRITMHGYELLNGVNNLQEAYEMFMKAASIGLPLFQAFIKVQEIVADNFTRQ